MDLSEASSRTASGDEATTAIETLLDQQVRSGLLTGDARSLAGRLVTRIWAQQPALFEGRLGPKPHQIAVAAIALAAGTRLEAYSNNEPLRSSYTFALGLILDEVALNAHAYAFHPVDHQLLDAAAATFSEPADELELSPLFESFGL